MKIEALLERLEYRQDSGAADDGVRYWRSHRFEMPVSVVDSIWETAWRGKVNRGTGSRAGLRRLELAILRQGRQVRDEAETFCPEDEPKSPGPGQTQAGGINDPDETPQRTH